MTLVKAIALAVLVALSACARPPAKPALSPSDVSHEAGFSAYCTAHPHVGNCP